MFWRLQLRTVRMAVAEGRWDEAAEALTDKELREFLPAKKLSQNLAGRLLGRARERFDQGASSAGWRDVNRAVELGGDAQAIRDFRESEQARRMDRVCRWIALGETQAALDELSRMKRRGIAGPSGLILEEVARKVHTANQRITKGEVSAAANLYRAAAERLAHQADETSLPSEIPLLQLATVLKEKLASCEQIAQQVKQLEPQLHQQIAACDWSGALTTADALLELAPTHPAARRARRRAWKDVGLEVTRAYQPPTQQRADRRQPSDATSEKAAPEKVASLKLGHPDRFTATTHHHTSLSDTKQVRDVSSNQHSGRRLVAWIDAVGGYLVCLGDEIVLGRPDPAGGVDVPILADLSRRHVVLRRDGGDYVLEPQHLISQQTVKVNGLPLTSPAVLSDGDILHLTDAVELVFRRPHVLSATAILEPRTHNKIQPAVDGIVLMSQTCVFGPQSHSHVRCRGWSSELVLVREGEELYCRSNTPLTVDDEPGIERAEIAENSRIEGEDFALSFESL
ncbi:FHA domain-containing protein [Adhaeretor mobilis]|uniref:FHA domain-containing protein n=1 Tax=Adhaeretor mobilis TaxID=1930276 RepID=A0A517MS92_9BACT|nr:FHA domain-containing protein [Adhaeretor mobilis]QDS97752.1 hypothetical protein HG15A2_10190 [Adhaeretor mobilis]